MIPGLKTFGGAHCIGVDIVVALAGVGGTALVSSNGGAGAGGF